MSKLEIKDEVISLPSEIIVHTLKYLTKKERYKYRLVSKEWYQNVNYSIDSFTLTDFSFVKKDFIEKGIKGFRFLQRIVIERSKIVLDGTIEEILALLPNLKELKVVHCEGITTLKLASLSLENIYLLNLSNLVSCEIKCPKIEGIYFGQKSLFACRSLNKLELDDSTFLNTLDICQTPLEDDDILKLLDSAKYLKNLYVYGCRKIQKGIASYFLKNLDLSSTNITDDDLSKILEKCPNLQELKIENCINLKNPKISSSLNLENLKIRMCKNLKNPTIELPNLKSLHIDLNDSLNQPWIKARCLTFLDLSKTPIKDVIAYDTLKNCQKVTKLNLKGCENISTLKLKHDKLQVLNLSLCRNINKDTSIICPNLVELIGTGIKLIGESSEFRKQISDNCHPFMRFIF